MPVENEALDDEVEAINAIYGVETLVQSGNGYILKLPHGLPSVRLTFQVDYPASPPQILGSESSGELARKGDAAEVVRQLKRILERIFVPGEVCLFTLLEDAEVEALEDVPAHDRVEDEIQNEQGLKTEPSILSTKPPWIISDVIIEKKSVFVCRAARVTSTEEASSFVRHLLATDKKVAKASHNMTAWRIHGPRGTSFQDCDDDGETAAGSRLLHLLQVMNVWDVMVIVTRWYGGVHLGPDRFRLINTTARDALVKGNFVESAKKR